MLSRNFRTALIISLGMHVLIMSAVSIIVPADIGRMRPYTRVEFLGSILRKKAFDIMLEKTDPENVLAYEYMLQDPGEEYLAVITPKAELLINEFLRYRRDEVDIRIGDFLTGIKTLPDFSLGVGAETSMVPGSSGPDVLRAGQRKVIYSPSPPLIMSGLYGDQERFRIKVRVLVGSDGNVKKTEPVTTTGYPRLDITAEKFAKSWIFEPRGSAGLSDEWIEAEVVMNTTD